MSDDKITEREALQAVRTIIQYVGDDPDRPGLFDTPHRFLKAWREDWGRGYREPPNNLIRMFKDPVDPQYDEMVVTSGIAFYSTCEHHLAPFFGTATVCYLPGEAGIIGLSKLCRVIDHLSRRLQVQERLTNQVADALERHVSRSVGVIMRATHMCMVSRGVQQPTTLTTTSALRGALLANPTARAEFLKLAGNGS